MPDPALFKVKNMFRDPAFYAAVALPILRYFDPHLASSLVHNWPVIAPYLLFLLGHFGVRIAGAHALGQATSAATLAGDASVEANPPTGDGAFPHAAVDLSAGEHTEDYSA